MKTARQFSILAGGLALALSAPMPAAVAQDAAKVTVTLKDHKFSPAEPTAPAGKPIAIEVVNLDSTPAEFESKALRVEKVIPAAARSRFKCVRCRRAGTVFSTTTMDRRPKASW